MLYLLPVGHLRFRQKGHHRTRLSSAVGYQQQAEPLLVMSSTNESEAIGTRPSKSIGSAPAQGQSVNKRLQSELMSLMMTKDAGISAFPDGDNIFHWTGTIVGGEGTVYEGLSYKLSLKFPTGYPYEPPQVTFTTPCFHPNVDQYGNICLDILKEKWSAVYNVRTILLSIMSLLGDPNLDSPLNGHAAATWNNAVEYKKGLLKHYKSQTSGARRSLAPPRTPSRRVRARHRARARRRACPPRSPSLPARAPVRPSLPARPLTRGQVPRPRDARPTRAPPRSPRCARTFRAGDRR